MAKKRSFPGLILLLGCILLSSCDDPLSPAPPDPPMGVTPRDTAAHTLIVNMTINEDQDAVDKKSDVSLGFRTDAIEEDNYVIFDNDEHVFCKDMLVALNNQAMYKFKLPQKRYICFYVGDTEGIGPLTPVLMGDVPLRSRLAPQELFVGQGYKIRYTADTPDLACPIMAVAKDNTNNIPGPSTSSSLGFYVGPSTSTLSGSGEIVLIRTCTWVWHNPFDTLTLIYQSEARVEVTWSH